MLDETAVIETNGSEGHLSIVFVVELDANWMPD